MCTPTAEVLNLICSRLVKDRRITEWFGLDGTFEVLVQPLSHGQGHPSLNQVTQILMER